MATDAATSYPQLEVNTVRRHKERGVYDYATVHGIVNAATILHVSFAAHAEAKHDFPTILPMIGTMCSFAGTDPAKGPLDLYVHGHAASRLMQLPTTSSTTTTTTTSSSSSTGSDGVPVCVSAAILDGLVLALTPFQHSCNYRSAVLFGHAFAVTDPAERIFALERITDGLVPDRWANSRVPPTGAELQSTGLLRIEVASASAKVHAGGPTEARRDLRDEAVTARVWAGVVPVWQQMGAPVPGPNNRVAKVPHYLEAWRMEENAAGKQYASNASVGEK